MTRARITGVAALAAAAALAGCSKSKVTAPTLGFAGPESVAVFNGITSASASQQPYFAVANALRDDLSLVNAITDAAVLAPIQLRSLAIPVHFRPTILASAPLGDVDAAGHPLPDLLVAVAGDSTLGTTGNSSLQLVSTWGAPNDVVGVTEVPGEVLAAISVPGRPAGTARLALALSGGRIAIVDYARVSGKSEIAVPQATAVQVSGALGFQPLSLAASDDGATVYAATLDPIGTPSVHGVAAVSLSTTAMFAVSAIDARGPTRLVAAAKLMERIGGSAATGTSAFAGQAAVQRVYAVLDESRCGISHSIDCGVAVLDPSTGKLANVVLPQAGGTTVPMKYIAPIELPSRPLAMAVSPPPVNAPAEDAANAVYKSPFMRLWPATGEIATTGVAAVPCENGRVYFLDLARWKVANDRDAVAGAWATVALVTPTAVPSGGTVRLSLVDLATGGHVLTSADQAVSGFDAVPAYVAITPGYTRDDVFTVSYQGALPSMSEVKAEAGSTAGVPWLAMQTTAGGIVEQVTRLWDPLLGVKPGDIVQIDAAGVAAVAPSCVGTEAPGAYAGTKKVFEVRVAALLQPSVAYPGGAVQLARETVVPVPPPAGGSIAPWGVCFDGLAAASGLVPNLVASIFAGDYLVTSSRFGHVGRPAVSAPPAAPARWSLDYDADEDSLACPLVPWPATGPTACDATCRQACDQLIAVRRARRAYNLAEACSTDACRTSRYPGIAFPDVAGPVVKFAFALDFQGVTAVDRTPRRGLHLTIGTLGGVSAFSGPPSNTTSIGSMTHPNGAVAFDRSQWDPGSGYRFLVPYTGDWVLDTSPSVQSAASGAIR